MVLNCCIIEVKKQTRDLTRGSKVLRRLIYIQKERASKKENYLNTLYSREQRPKRKEKRGLGEKVRERERDA